MNQDFHNNHTDDSQAQEVRQRSEFIKRVEDFARFMQKEYIDNSDDRSLLLNAVDKSFSKDKAALAMVTIGDKPAVLSGLAEMLRDDKFRELINDARALTLRDDGGTVQEAIADVRRHLRRLWMLVALLGLWAAVLVFTAVAGVCSWFTTLTSLYLCAFLGWLVRSEIRTARRRLTRLSTEQQADRDRLHNARMMATLHDFVKHLHSSEDEDED